MRMCVLGCLFLWLFRCVVVCYLPRISDTAFLFVEHFIVTALTLAVTFDLCYRLHCSHWRNWSTHQHRGTLPRGMWYVWECDMWGRVWYVRGYVICEGVWYVRVCVICEGVCDMWGCVHSLDARVSMLVPHWWTVVSVHHWWTVVSVQESCCLVVAAVPVWSLYPAGPASEVGRWLVVEGAHVTKVDYYPLPDWNWALVW